MRLMSSLTFWLACGITQNIRLPRKSVLSPISVPIFSASTAQKLNIYRFCRCLADCPCCLGCKGVPDYARRCVESRTGSLCICRRCHLERSLAHHNVSSQVFHVQIEAHSSHREPEAAAVHCAYLTDLHKLRPSQNFMICDAGGGTVVRTCSF